MKKLLLLLILTCTLLPNHLSAQALGESAIKEILNNVFDNQLPKILGNGLLEGLNVGTIKIRPGYIKIKGQTKWNLKLGKHTKPIKFKGNISTRLKSFGKSNLKVNFPGDRFLFFPKYQKLNDLIDLKKGAKKNKG